MKITKRALAFLLAVVMLVAAFPIAVSTAAVEAKESSILDDTATAYDKLYVQDGLVMLLSAFDQAKAGITTDEGGNFKTWNNKVKAGTDATFYNYVDAENAANSILWKNRTDKGVGYDLTADQQGTSGRTVGMNAYLYLGNGIVDVAKNYSVEYSAIWLGTSADGVQTAGTANLSSHNEKFGAWGSAVFGNFANYMTFCYNANGLNGDFGNDTQIFRSLIWKGGAKVQTVSNVMTLNADKTSAHRDVYANAAKDGGTTQANGHAWMTGSIPGSNTVVKTPITNSTEFWLTQNMANTTYAVRVYSRDLTVSEIQRNTLVDVLAYHSVNVSGVAFFDAEQLTYVFNNLDASIFNYTADKAAMQAEFDRVVALVPTEKLDSTATAYDKLYEQDGLVMLLSAFDQAKAGITTDASGNFKTWNNKVAIGSDATFYSRPGTGLCPHHPDGSAGLSGQGGGLLPVFHPEDPCRHRHEAGLHRRRRDCGPAHRHWQGRTESGTGPVCRCGHRRHPRRCRVQCRL